MTSRNLTWLVLLLGFLFLPSARAKNIVIATSSITLTNVPIWIGIERKFFDEAGLTVQYVVMRSDLAVRGLVTGDIDYAQSASSVVRAGAAGAPVAPIFGNFNRTFFDLVGKPELKTLADLRAKTIAISRHGDSNDYAVRFALRANGIDPDKEIKFLAVGGDSSKIAALQQGLAAAIVIGVPANFAAEKLGNHSIASLGPYMETLFAGLGASRRKIAENRNEVRRVIRSMVRSNEYLISRPPEVKNIIQKKFGGIDKRIADYTYDLLAKALTVNGIPSEQALQNSLLGTPFENKITSFDGLVDFSVAREIAAA